MAKISFTKLNAKLDTNVKVLEFNDQKIEVRQYLPVNDKLGIIERVINQSAEDMNYANPLKITVYAALEVLYNYTNITFTDKQKEAPEKLFDTIYSSGLFTAVQDVIPQTEWDDLFKGLWDTIDEVYKYQNSAMGIMETISKDYSNLDLSAAEIQKKLADPETLPVVKDILTKLG